MINETNTKICNTCKLRLDLTKFHKNRKCTDGKDYYCKDCVKKRDQNRLTDDYKKARVELKLKHNARIQNLACGLKTCTNCELTLGLTNFNKNIGESDGLQSNCRSCQREYKKSYRSRNVEKNKIEAKLYRTENRDTCIEATRRWHLKNKEHSKVVNSKWRSENLEKYTLWVKDYGIRYSERKKQLNTINYYNNRISRIEQIKTWRLNNPDKVRNIVVNWRNNNRDRSNANFAKRRASKKFACPLWAQNGTYKAQILEIYRQSKKLSESTGIQYNVDHCIPLQPPKVCFFEGEMIALVCGLHVPNNLQILTATENQQKSNKFESYIESELDPNNLLPWQKISESV